MPELHDSKHNKTLTAPLSAPPPVPSSRPGSGGSHHHHNGHPEPPRVIELHGQIGLDSIPHQTVKKCIQTGFQFNLLCVGETGMGKTTLIESLFNMKLEFEQCNSELKTVELRAKTFDVHEGSITLKLTLVETAGFGDQLDKDKSAKIIVDYIDAQFEAYLKEELKMVRRLADYEDTRVHVCLYFISPTGHGLKALDVVTLRELAKRVNVIPIIAKSDTTSKDELKRFKQKILSELRANKIDIYQFPTDDETVAAVNKEMNEVAPFAVVGSTDFVKKENGKMVRARQYPWGIVEVENEKHCDFVKLREALLRTNVDALRENTHQVLYENYRRERLRAMRMGDGDAGPRFAQMSKQKGQELQEEQQRQDERMREAFAKKLREAEDRFRSQEDALAVREREVEEKYGEEMRKLDADLKRMAEDRAKADAKGKGKHRK